MCTTRWWERSSSGTDLPVDQSLDLRVEGVDGLLTFGQHPDHLIVATQEGTGRPRQVFSDHGEQFDDLGFDCLQRALKFLSMLGHGQSLPGAILTQQQPHLPAPGPSLKGRNGFRHTS